MKWSVFVVCAALLASVVRAQDPGTRLGFTSIRRYFIYNNFVHPDAVEPRHCAGQINGSYDVSALDTPRQTALRSLPTMSGHSMTIQGAGAINCYAYFELLKIFVLMGAP